MRQSRLVPITAAAAGAAIIIAGCGGSADVPVPEISDGSPPMTGSAAPTSPEPTVTQRSEVTAKPKVPAGMTASYVVFDRESGRTTARLRSRRVYRSASLVKLLIVLDYLHRRGPDRGVPARDRELLVPMLRASDDAAATTMWNRGGRRAIVRRTATRLGLADTRPPPADKPGFWGYTAISAADITKIYRHLFSGAPPRHRDFVLRHLRKATPCGADRFDQSFGIPRAVHRPWAVKQGWSGWGTVPVDPCSEGTSGLGFRPAAAPSLGIGRPVLHTTGVVGAGDRWIMVVLTLQRANSSYAVSTKRITTLTRRLYRAATG